MQKYNLEERNSVIMTKFKTKRIIDIKDLQGNVENVISKVLREEEYCYIQSVTYENGIVTITFEEADEMAKKNSCYVKKVSKGKHKQLAEFFRNNERHGRNGYLVATIELRDCWILFYNK